MAPAPGNASTANQAPPTLGSGRYIVTSLLGKGGTARVYRGWDDRLRTWRAIKVLSPAHVDDPSMRERFMNEARTMARFEHPNLIQTVDVVDDPHTPFFVMELAEGGAVIDWLKRNGAMSPHLALQIVRAMCDALSMCHSQNIVHRDVKPHNLLIDRKGRCKLTDFGIAQLDANMNMTQTGSQMGTFAYMAPEQRTDAKSVDHRADLYAVGATLFTMLTCKTSADLFVAEADDDLFDGLLEPVVAFLVKSCAYKPAARFQTADEMLEATEALLAIVPPPPADERALSEKLMGLPDGPPAALTDLTDLDELLMGLARHRDRPAVPASEATPPAPKPAPSLMPYQMSRPTVDRNRTFADVSDSSEGQTPSYLTDEEIERERLLANAQAVANAAKAIAAEAERNQPPPPPEVKPFDVERALWAVIVSLVVVAVLTIILASTAFLGRGEITKEIGEAEAAYGALLQAVQRDPGLLEDLSRAGASAELRAAYFAWQDAETGSKRATAFVHYLDVLDAESSRLAAAGATAPLAAQKVNDILRARATYRDEIQQWQTATSTFKGTLAVQLGMAARPPATY